MIAGSEIAGDARFWRVAGRADQEEMRALAAAIGAPMAVEQVSEDFGLDLGFFGGVIPRLVAGIVVTLRPDGGEEEDLLAVRRPDGAIGFRGKPGELAGRGEEGSSLGMEELHEDLRNSVAHGGEEDLFAIGRKAKAVFGSQARLGEAVRFAAGKRNNPEVRLLGVVGKRDLNGREGNPAANLLGL